MSNNHRDIENLLRRQMDVGSSHIEHVHTGPRTRPAAEEHDTTTTPRDASILERIRGKLALRQVVDVDDETGG